MSLYLSKISKPNNFHFSTDVDKETVREYYTSIANLNTLAVHNRPIFTNECLTNRFTKFKKIGKGGDGIVFEVVDKASNIHKAIKINTYAEKWLPRSLKYVYPVLDVLNLNYTPHLTHIEEIIKIETEDDEFSIEEPKSSNFVASSEGKSKIKYLPAIVMECLDGDLEKKFKGLSSLERDAIAVQSVATRALLENWGVKVGDYKLRNMFYKKLDINDIFNGKRLIDFDYWKYTLDCLDFFIPRQEYLLKFGDFDSWTNIVVLNELEKKSTALNLLESDLEECRSIQEVAQQFRHPEDPNAKIINVM